jgi:HK97 family phage portal protein
MGIVANLRSEYAWRKALPIIRAASPQLRASVAYQLATKASFGSVVDTTWYQREGYDLLSRALGGYSSHTGTAITADNAFESAAFYAGVKIISEDLGRLPFILFERTEDKRGENPAFSHPIYPVLKNLWNPDVAAGEGVEALTAHALVTGNGFAKKERKGSDGTLQWLFPLQPQNVRMEGDKPGRVVYQIREDNNLPEKTFSADDIFRLTGFSLNGIVGDEILRRARHTLGLTLSAQEYAGRWFANDAAVGIVFERPHEAPLMGDVDLRKFKDQFKAWHQGKQKAGEPAVVQEGMKLARIPPDHDKTQLIEQRKFQLLEVCRLLRMKPHKLADLDRATFSNIEEENIGYIVDTLGPWVKRWRNAVFRDLLSREEQIDDRLFAQMNVEAFLQGNFEKQAKGIAMLLEKGLYSINEGRALLHFNPIEGGDEHYIQLNMQSITDAATGAVADSGSKLFKVETEEDAEKAGYVNGKGE